MWEETADKEIPPSTSVLGRSWSCCQQWRRSETGRWPTSWLLAEWRHSSRSLWVCLPHNSENSDRASALCLPQQRPLMCRISAAPWAVSNDGHRCTSAGVCPAPGSLRRISSPASFDPDRDRGRETFVKNEKNITPCSEFSKCSGYYYLTSDLDQEDQLFGVKTSLRSFALTLCKGQLWGKKKETE